MNTGHRLTVGTPVSKDRLVTAILAAVTLPVVINIWLSAVSNRVGEPYLDEVFHVGQAQTYCAGKFRQWDPKITTPPGLYLLSYLVYKLSGSCGLSALRLLNAAMLVCIFFVVTRMAFPATARATRPKSFAISGFSLYLDSQQLHTALNISLFPPLFFFCGLYYTDVASTLFVLLFSKHFFDIHQRGTPTAFQSILSVSLALTALTFRQTNIFWVAVFPIGFLAIAGLAEKRDSTKSLLSPDCTWEGESKRVVESAWREATLYDPQVRGAWLEDYLLVIASVVVLAVRILSAPHRVLRLVRVILPYAVVLALFAGFVFSNGGVVLGDKSNHVATLHLPQMLYIWPYITFFSIPLTYPFIIQAALATSATIPVLRMFEPLLVFSRYKVLPRPMISLACVGLIMVIVKFNTIVHPFTLADNRHYTFYVFRILLRHPMVRYVVVPIYVIGAWSVIQALGAPAKLLVPGDDGKTLDVDDPEKEVKSAASSGLSIDIRPNDASYGDGCTVSFVLVWLVTSALTLVTAPLVEPRYFIIPWIMWRLRVPQAHPDDTVPRPYQKLAANLRNQNTGMKRARAALGQIWRSNNDHRLWLETLWFLVINAATGWAFLNKGYTWPQEPQNVQRFMW